MESGAGVMIILWLIAGVAALVLYTIPALVLALSKHSNRVAAWFVLIWSILPTGLFVLLRTAAREELRNEFGDGAPVLSILMLAPTAFMAWRAWLRLEARGASEPAELVVPAPARAELPSNFLVLWTGAIVLDRLIWIVGFRLLIASSGGRGSIQTTFFILSALSWILLSSLQWLILKNSGISSSWILASSGSGILAELVCQLVETSIGGIGPIARSALFSLGYSIPVAVAQWACLPPRFVKRSLWLAAFPAVEVCVVTFISAASSEGGTRTLYLRETLQIFGAAAVGASTGAVLRYILMSSAPKESAPERTA